MSEEKKEGFMKKLGRLFSGKKKEDKPALKQSSMGSVPKRTSKDAQAAAMAEIARKSALVKNSMSTVKSHKSTDIMGDLADDFHRLNNGQQSIKETKE